MAASPTPYPDRPWIVRRLSFLRQRMRVAFDREGEGVFATDQILPGMDAWKEGSPDFASLSPVRHAHFSFLSHTYAERGWWYDARMLTVDQAAMEMLEERVDEAIEALFKARGVSWGQALGTCHEGGHAPLRALADAKGRPRSGWQCYRDAWKDMAQTNWKELPLKMGVKRDLGLPSYVGLDVVVDRQALDKAFVAGFVRSFWSSGEIEWGRLVDWSVHGPALEEQVAQMVAIYDGKSAARQPSP